MARPKMIDDQTVLDLTKEFYATKCNYMAEKLTIPAIAEYIKEKTGTNYSAVLLRRNKLAKEYINSMISTKKDMESSLLVTHKTLDVETFLDTHTTRNSLKSALTELDAYYKTVYDSAIELNRISTGKAKKYEQLEAEIANLKTKVDRLTAENKECKDEIKDLKHKNTALLSVVNTYVYPEIANQLLEKEGFLTNAAGIITDTALNENVINADTNIFSDSNVIQGLFSKWDNEDE